MGREGKMEGVVELVHLYIQIDRSISGRSIFSHPLIVLLSLSLFSPLIRFSVVFFPHVLYLEYPLASLIHN